MCRLFTLAILLLLSGCDASRQNRPGPVTQYDASETITLKADGISLLGHDLAFPFTVSEMEAIIGPPDRVAQLANNLSTWDDVGIVAYEESPGEPVHSVEISFCQREYDFSPSHGFGGIVLYNDVAISGDSTRDELVSAGLTRDDTLGFLHTAQEGDFEIIATYENGVVGISIGR